MNTQSMFMSPYDLSRFMEDIDYKEFDYLMSADEVLAEMQGSCHDQVMLELEELFKLGLNPNAKFIMAVDKDNIGGETHTFVYWSVGSTLAYWFENAWEDYRGIHRFSGERELIDYIVDAFKKRNPHQYIFLSDFIPENHTIGEDLDTLVDICMTTAIQL